MRRVCVLCLVPCRVWWKGWCAHIDYATACVCVRVCVRACGPSRLVLCHATALCFRKCMELLGINPIERL